jgi:hypothetical protein
LALEKENEGLIMDILNIVWSRIFRIIRLTRWNWMN